MPCQGPSASEMAAMRASELKRRMDALTLENDQLRDLIYRVANDPNYTIPAKVKKDIEKRQVVHRQEDLDRLEDTFTKAKDAERLAKVWAADPKKPLEDQLGFNPDDF